jgi:hypothetical protein
MFFQNSNNNNSIQFFIYLHAHLTAQRPTVKYARAKKEIKQPHTYKQKTTHGNLFNNNNSIQFFIYLRADSTAIGHNNNNNNNNNNSYYYYIII